MAGAIFLEGDKTNLRTIEEEDLEFLRDGINNPEIREYLTARKPVNLEQEKEFFENVISSEDDVYLAICREKEMIGIISLEEKESELIVAEIGIWIDTGHHGNGYGTEAAELVTNYGFNELNYHRIMARAQKRNKGSNRIWKKLGFEKEGEFREHTYTDGEFENVCIYSILEDEWN